MIIVEIQFFSMRTSLRRGLTHSTTRQYPISDPDDPLTTMATQHEHTLHEHYSSSYLKVRHTGNAPKGCYRYCSAHGADIFVKCAVAVGVRLLLKIN